VWLRHDPGDDEAAQGTGSQERAGGPGADRGAGGGAGEGKAEKEAHGEFESEHPGYCGAQDTLYVGNLKGGRAHLSADPPSPSSMTATRRSPPPIS
jgi:hypothetical protein